MPNHVTTELTAPKHVIHALLTEDGVDFERIIPQPKNVEQGDCSGTHDEGVICWRNWRIDVWGTKWNAYETEMRSSDDTVVRFDTAWAHPEPVIVALSQMFPDVEIDVKYADDALGANCDHYVIRGGEVIHREGFGPGSEEALEFAAQLKYGQSYADLRAEWGDDE